LGDKQFVALQTYGPVESEEKTNAPQRAKAGGSGLNGWGRGVNGLRLGAGAGNCLCNATQRGIKGRRHSCRRPWAGKGTMKKILPSSLLERDKANLNSISPKVDTI